jgi:hypothetical protein
MCLRLRPHVLISEYPLPTRGSERMFTITYRITNYNALRRPLTRLMTKTINAITRRM